MHRLEVSGALRLIYASLCFKGLINGLCVDRVTKFSNDCSSPQINLAVQTPVLVPNKTVAVALGFQFNFVLPTNVTEFRQRNATRFRRDVGEALQSVYLPFEALLQEYGFDGRMCMLRSICEAAHSPFNHEDNGLLEEMAHSILTYVIFMAYVDCSQIIVRKISYVYVRCSLTERKGKSLLRVKVLI